MTGLSRAQGARLIGTYLRGEPVQAKRYRRYRFPPRYQIADIELSTAVDAAHKVFSGPATQQILQWEMYDYGDERYARLAQLSIAHLYRLRQSGGSAWGMRRRDPPPVRVGERRAPRPEGRPGYLRVDTVHQGDLDGAKGVYHLNAVDEVTQWQVVTGHPGPG